jgi:membrane-bound lytic murein transglycosylase A
MAVTPAAGKSAMKLSNAQTEPLSYAALDRWADDDHAAAFGSFLNSCKAILNGSKAMRAARPVYGALFEVCGRAVAAGPLDRAQARRFFEENFKPVRIAPVGESEGFLTGYYETVVDGARYPSSEYNVPVYGKPSNLVMPIARQLAKTAVKAVGKIGRRFGRRKVVPYYDRTEIEDGVLAGRGLEICWVKNPVDAFFAQIQGSTRVKLDTGQMLRLNYDAHNGLPYTAVGKFLIDRGIVSKEEMSMDKIRQFMEANPEEGKELRRKNRSFVFFREVALGEHDECIGAQGVPLTAGRSLAMDKSIHVYGTPFWIEAQLPIDSEKPETPFRRLLIAQDTGSAILGPARADIYFGSGEEIGHVAGRIKQHGKFVMLVPRTLPIGDDAKDVPLPKPRPAMAAQNEAPPAAAKLAAEKPAERAAAAVPVPKPRPGT